MAAHLLADTEASTTPRVRMTGPNYHGLHRRPVPAGVGVPGTLVLEPGSQIPSSVIALIDVRRALVRHVSTCDDHVVLLDSLRPFADGYQVRIGADHGNSH
jgi:hypothetical protein